MTKAARFLRASAILAAMACTLAGGAQADARKVALPPALEMSAADATSSLRLGATFSSAQSSSQSFLRFYNTGTSAGTAVVTLSNGATGAALGQWTSSSIPAGAEVQFAISGIENELGLGANKPAYYSLSIQSAMSGYFQHILWRTSNGTLTNLSTCGTGVAADPAKLSGVHTSLLQPGFPSTVVVNNTGTSSAIVALGIYDARNGARLGTYNTSPIPAGGQLMLPASNFELVTGAPPAGMYHYVVKAEGTFSGFLQHLVDNTQAGVITDMTTVCALSASAGIGGTGGTGTGGGTYTLNTTNNSAGTGSGTVTASPSASTYANGTVVTLTATPSTGSIFVGWSGGCSGTVATCQITIGANSSVVATFNQNTPAVYPLTGNWTGTWNWSGPNASQCNTQDGGAFTVTLAQPSSAVFSGSNVVAAGIQSRNTSTCALTQTSVGGGSISGGRISGNALTFSMVLSIANSSTDLIFDVTGVLNGNRITGTVVRSTGGTGSISLTKN